MKSPLIMDMYSLVQELTPPYAHPCMTFKYNKNYFSFFCMDSFICKCHIMGGRMHAELGKIKNLSRTT